MFPAYRNFEAARVGANDAMMALLVSSRLGTHVLTLNRGSTHRLAELFPAVPDVRRFNRTVEDAGELIAAAEGLLAAMAIPFVLSVHHTLMSDVFKMWDADRGGSTERPKLTLANVHEVFSEESGARLQPAELKLFHLARRLRNRCLHYGGVAGSRLPREYRLLSPEARLLWETLAGRGLGDLEPDRPVVLTAGELTAVLAVTTRLAREVNRQLQRCLSPEFWADTVVQDFLEQAGGRVGQRATLHRRLSGFARHQYALLGLKEGQLSTAMERAGL